MCLAVCNPEGKILDYSEMERAFDGNPDGAGFAYAENGEVVISKGYWKFQELWDDYCETVGMPSILHFRYATHGKVTHRNCHPFQVNRGLAMAHNGVLPTRSTVKKSDTHCLVLDVVRPLADLVFDDLFKQSLEKHIGTGNKLVFLNGQGDYSIYNETMGHWSGKVWYSNSCYRQPKFAANYFFPPISQRELDAIPWKYSDSKWSREDDAMILGRHDDDDNDDDKDVGDDDTTIEPQAKDDADDSAWTDSDIVIGSKKAANDADEPMEPTQAELDAIESSVNEIVLDMGGDAIPF